MKDNVQIAGHLQDVVRGLGDVEHAVRSQPQPRVDVPANVVVVNVPGTFELGYSRGLVNGGTGTNWFLLTGTI